MNINLAQSWDDTCLPVLCLELIIYVPMLSLIRLVTMFISSINNYPTINTLYNLLDHDNDPIPRSDFNLVNFTLLHCPLATNISRWWGLGFYTFFPYWVVFAPHK